MSHSISAIKANTFIGKLYRQEIHDSLDWDSQRFKLRLMRFKVFIALSLALHALLFLVSSFWKPDHLIRVQGRRQPVEVVYVKKSKEAENLEKTFVRQLKVPDNLKFEDPAEAQFSSETRQRVLQETRAQISGLTKNRDRGPRYMEETENRPLPKKKKISDSGDEFVPFNPKNELQKLQGGESTISVKLPDNIAVGSFTALNTDRNVYYTFYARLEDMIYLRWADLIKKAVDHYSVDFKKRKLTGRSWKTNVVILLRPNGEFHQAQIHTPSGIEQFDISPALAFQDARIFPNPPPEMVRSDGFIHISYSFVVDFGRVQ